LARYKYTWALLGLLLLISPLLPVIGREVNGARIWVGIPGAQPGTSLAQFEPWELVKIALVIFFAACLDEYRAVLSSTPLRFEQAYELTQGLFSLAHAGILGAGLGNGMPERIPVVWSDFVFDAFTEEVGFAGALALLALYLVFVYRGMLIALRAPTTFLQL